MSAGSVEFLTAARTSLEGRRSGLGRRMLHSASGLSGLILSVLLLALIAALALGVLPHDPLEQHPLDALQGPSGEYWLGTDQFGRDMFARTIDGTRLSLQVALVSILVAATAGTVAGIAAGFFRGPTDGVLRSVSDVLFAFPAILLALVVVTALGSGWLNTALAVGIVYMPIFFRVARAPVLSLREREFILAGRLLGYSSGRLLLRHVAPNIVAVIMLQVTLSLAWAILTESSLSFLGLGTQPPNASLGLMVSEATSLASTAWWTLAGPAVAIAVAVLAVNLFGDGLRDALDLRR